MVNTTHTDVNYCAKSLEALRVNEEGCHAATGFVITTAEISLGQKLNEALPEGMELGLKFLYMSDSLGLGLVDISQH